MKKQFYFTSESVSSGHPDKLADQISDLVLDYFLTQDNKARVAAEAFVTATKIILAGEVRTTCHIDIVELESKIRNLIKDVGYVKGLFRYDKVEIEIDLREQSPDIARGVDEGDQKPEGAGDQGIMFGYACGETKDFMPAPIYYSHLLLKTIYDRLKEGNITNFGPDAKAQITFKYIDGKPVEIDTVLVSIQHEDGMSKEDVAGQIKPVILDIIPNEYLSNAKFLFNPTGKFVIGGPESDVGLTGRKIIVDTYGGSAPHGGGAFSGKDPSKVDRSAAYMARYLAKNVVAGGLAEKCLIQLSYAIGVAEPISFYLDSFGTAKIDDQEIVHYLANQIDLTPKGIRTKLNLNKAIYLPTATYGHFGREYNHKQGLFTWENTNLATKLAEL